MWGDEIEWVADSNVPRGTLMTRGSILGPNVVSYVVHPYDLLLQENRGKLPLYTRHTLGAIEAERDRRRHSR